MALLSIWISFSCLPGGQSGCGPCPAGSALAWPFFPICPPSSECRCPLLLPKIAADPIPARTGPVVAAARKSAGAAVAVSALKNIGLGPGPETSNRPRMPNPAPVRVGTCHACAIRRQLPPVPNAFPKSRAPAFISLGNPIVARTNPHPLLAANRPLPNQPPGLRLPRGKAVPGKSAWRPAIVKG